jgi:MFS family permease
VRPPPGPPSRGRAGYALAVLFAINTLNFYDRQVIGVVGEPLRREWELNDRALGVLGTAFTLFYAAAGLPLGWLTDRFSRRRILAGGVLVWSLLTAASGLARTYWQLFAARLGMGAGEAACAPASTSLLGDLFPPRQRGRALSVFMLGLPAGIALSYFVSGRVTAATDSWRAAFLVAGLPGILLALVALTLPEPARGAAEVHLAPAPAPAHAGSPFLAVLRIPTLLWIVVSGALHNFNFTALSLFLSPYLMRRHGLTVGEAGDIAMTTAGLSGFAGLLAGGFCADVAARRGPGGRLVTGAVSMLASVPLVYLALTRPAGATGLFLALMAAGTALMYVYYSAVYATIQDVVAPALRGTAMAVYFFAMYVLGAALGPTAIGELSDRLARRAARAAGVTDLTSAAALDPFRAQGLEEALLLLPLLSLLLAGVLYAASRTVKADMARRGA